MTDTRDPRYIRTVGLTLLAVLLVVASCQVEPLSTNIEVGRLTPEGVEEPLPTADTEPEAVQAEPQELRPAEPQEIRPEDRAAIQAGPVFTPMTVSPEILNRSEVQQALIREYPSLLREAGIGGRVVVWYYISETGQVLDSRIGESSGHMPLDEAALKVAAVFRFTPAMLREERVPVWIQLPITFQR